MTTLPIRTLGLAVMLALSAQACRKADNTQPLPPKSLPMSPSTGPDLQQEDKPMVVETAAPSPDMAVATPRIPAGPVAGADRAFLAEAANSGLAEVEASRLVAGRTDNAAIKSFAQQLERDHVSANDELKRLAEQKGVQLPTTIGGEPRGQLSKLTTMSKSDMDRTFLEEFGIKDHRKAISQFERQARETQDPDVKAFAERTLAKLREHLAMAQQMQTGQATGSPPP